MEKIRILGIAASPRHANTEIAVKEALAGAAELPDIETDFYTMAGHKINLCTCATKSRCYTEGTEDNPCPTWGPNDAVALLYKHMMAFDGFIMGSPVYSGGISAQMKAFWDRFCMMEYATGRRSRNKPVGAVSVASYREGGQEHTLVEILRVALIMDLIPVGPGPDIASKVSIYGGGLTHSYSPSAMVHSVHPKGSPEEMAAVKNDELGLLSCRNTGRRVAEIARVLKTGFKGLPREATYWPPGATEGVRQVGWKL